ncbi:AAA family ATPase [Candidatus Gracilibacteria bacterium]|nr:AAA family ATPase [Candidatus Gracilibacteria bacterium]
MNNKNRSNFFSLNLNNFYEIDKNIIKNTINTLNNDKLVIVSGMRKIGKVNFIKNLINKTKTNNNYFYFNKADDLENKIKNNLDILNLLNDYVKLYKIPKIIILQNISKIEGIKNFISYLYKNKYKVILLGNDIKISGIKEIEIKNNIYLNEENINNKLLYGNINIINDIEDIRSKKNILKILTNDIFLNSIFKDFSVKSIDLYIFTITFLAKYNSFNSLREIQKELNQINKISLKTVIDYIDFSIQAKIIKKCYKYDLKNSKIINSKIKYYFNDNGIRNSLANFNLKNKILIENLIFNILDFNNYDIYSGLNGKFEFSFYGEKADENIFIHISESKNKDELKKEINKLNKIKINGVKYLLVKDLKKLKIKKIKYDSVIILEINNFLINFKQK